MVIFSICSLLSVLSVTAKAIFQSYRLYIRTSRRFHFIQNVLRLPVAGCAMGRRRHGYVVDGTVCVCGAAVTAAEKERTSAKYNHREQS